MGCKGIAALVLACCCSCTSATGTIAREAVNVRDAAVRAQRELAQAQQELEAISESASSVAVATAYVSDDESTLVQALKYSSYIAGALAVGAVAYVIKTKT